MTLLRKIILVVCSVLAFAVASFLLIFNNKQNEDNRKLALPFEINQSKIVLEKIINYSGQYPNGCDYEYVSEIAAAVVWNNSNKILNSAILEVMTDGPKYIFEISMLPPGGRALVLNRDRNVFTDRCIIKCNGTVAFDTNQVLIAAAVEIQNDGAIRVVNNSDMKISSIIIFHRCWDEEQEMFLGEYAYKTSIKDLYQGDELYIRPGYTFPPNCKIILKTGPLK